MAGSTATAHGLRSAVCGLRSAVYGRAEPFAGSSVQNNLSLGNMDWEEFAEWTDPDGVFRRFPE